MIDLRQKGLPDGINVCGSFFKIKTDFREWIKFDELMQTGCDLSDLEYLFVDEVPLVEYRSSLMEFYLNPNATPKASTGGERIVDYVLDGEYITASFWAVYGINLTDVSLHWHLFKALFIGLPDNCKIKEIMSFRAYRKNTKKEDTLRNELKNAWRLPDKQTEQTEESRAAIMAEINADFYNC